ncbi:MAG: ferritin-like domain-containing protein [Chloroflexia bacterium]|nr:ferritin-like domain-containing protein [Chloroflexia bacterium]
MQPLHERLLAEVFEERQRLTSRRRLLAQSATLAAGGAMALTFTDAPGLLGGRTVSAQTTFADDVEVLNYALTLEHLEFAFYRDGLEQFSDADFGESPFGVPISERLTAIRDHEEAHVETLTTVITDLGGEPVQEAEYDFGYTDAATFLATAQALENTGVSAYDGAGQFLENPDLLTAAGTIVAVEARHASYLNLLNGVLPFPAPFETPLTPDEVLAIAGPFIVSADAEATPEA